MAGKGQMYHGMHHGLMPEMWELLTDEQKKEILLMQMDMKVQWMEMKIKEMEKMIELKKKAVEHIKKVQGMMKK